MNDYYLNKLSPEEAEAYQNIYRGLKRGSECIRTGLERESNALSRVVKAVKYDHVELFNVNFSEILRSKTANGIQYHPTYIYGFAQSQEIKEKIERKANEIISELNATDPTSIYEKCLWLHNYMVRNCTYDYDGMKDGPNSRSAHSIEGFFVSGKAVCEGIAKSYRYLCNKLGIDAIVAEGRSIHPGCSDYGWHAWNIILSKESAIQTDVTWDMCITQEDGPIRYDYFFMPDIEMMRDHQYVGYPICSNKELNMYAQKNAWFSSVDQIKGYLDRILEKKNEKNKVFVQFKMSKRKETKEEICKIVMGHVRNKTSRRVSCTYITGELQSVFLFELQFE